MSESAVNKLAAIFTSSLRHGKKRRSAESVNIGATARRQACAKLFPILSKMYQLRQG